MILTNNICKNFDCGAYVTSVLADVSLEIPDGSIVSITGKSGSGKSTLLNLLCGMDVPTSGEVYHDEIKISGMAAKALSAFRLQNCGFVFQDYRLVSTLSVYDNIILPAVALHGAPDQEWVKEILQMTGMAEMTEKFPFQLSGGERQRASIARAIVNRPAVLFADEPTGNLDEENTQTVMRFLLEYAQKTKCIFVYVTHERDLAELADRMLLVENKSVRILR